jgi:bacterioferritin-associated ferredoxin
MKPSCSSNPCFGCTDRTICRCLGVQESTVVEAIVTLGLRTVKEIRQHTGAGDGCTCCHAELRRCLREHAPLLTAEAV